MVPSATRSTSPQVTRRQPIGFGPRSGGSRVNRPTDAPTSPSRAVSTVVGSLVIVLGLFGLIVWVSRKAGPKGVGPLPEEVVESLGRAPLNVRQQMQLVRVGRKLLLLCVTPNGAETLTEITDPAEVDHLAGLCRQRQPGSITETFRQVLAAAGDEGEAVSGQQSANRGQARA